MSKLEELLTAGKKSIGNAIRSYKQKPIYIQTVQMFGDTLHSSLIVAHYRAEFPERPIIWGVGERFVDTHKLNPHASKIIGLPMVDADDKGNHLRRSWVEHAEKVGARAIGHAVAIAGHQSHNIASSNILNAGIKESELKIPRKPILEVSEEDINWAVEFEKKNGLEPHKYATMEYRSITFSGPPHNITWSPEIYNRVIEHSKYPIVYLGAAKEPEIKGGIDGRGTTFRQAKVLIRRSKVFAGCGSGLTMVASTANTNTKIIEVNIDTFHNMRGCGYADSTALYQCTPIMLAREINQSFG